MKCNQVFFILSAERPEYSLAVNVLRNEELTNQLKAMGFNPTRGQGRYKGTDEFSVLVAGSSMHTESLTRLACNTYGQDCILKVYSDNAAFLVTTHNGGLSEEIPAGFLRWTNSKPSGDYSKFNGSYFELKGN